MASAPPDPANQETDRRREAEALALLLLGTKRRYDLPALIRANRIRPRAFRQIRPTSALKYDLSAPYHAIVRAWADEQPALLSAYASGNPTLIQAAIDRAAARVEIVVRQAQARFPAVVGNVERWHRAQWASRIKASTGLDVSMFTQPGDVATDMQATTAWNGQLATDVHRQVQHGVATALLAGAAASMPAGNVQAKIAEVVAKAKKRSAGIGDDQIDKLSRAMDRSRREAASVTDFVWHHTPQKHPRDWHKARDGKTFGPDDIEAADRAGVPPFCKCWESPKLV